MGNVGYLVLTRTKEDDSAASVETLLSIVSWTMLLECNVKKPHNALIMSPAESADTSH